MPEFITIAKTKDIPAAGSKCFQFQGKEVAIYNCGGRFFATSNVCRHEGGSLSEGELSGNVIMCPLHGWEYNIESGECLTAPGADLDVYSIQVVGDAIKIKL